MNPSRAIILTGLPQLYYAELAWVGTNKSNGLYTANLALLEQFAPLGPAALNGTCTGLPHVVLSGGGTGFTATVSSATSPSRVASVTDERHLLVH